MDQIITQTATQTAPRTMPHFLGPEFNRFLFAAIGTDRNGGQLSVVSALARLDLDAWAEAATLARLPRAAAVQKLSAMLRRYPEIPRLAQESGAVAAGLIALLPAGSGPVRQAAVTFQWREAGGSAALAVIIALGLVLVLQFAPQGPSPHVAASHAATTTLMGHLR